MYIGFFGAAGMLSEIILRMVASRSELVEAASTVGAEGIVVDMSILADRAEWG